MSPWLALGGVLALVLILVVVQLVLPTIAANRVGDRLTEGGGSAEVELSAFPAPRLLFGDGDRIEVRGSGLDLDLDEGEPEVFERLDGFDRVAVDLVDFRAGPFAVGSFRLERDGGNPYRLVARATTSPSELVGYGSELFGLPGGSLLGAFAERALGGRTTLPVSLQMEVESDGGAPRVVSGNGAIAGIPAGPIAQLLTSVIVARL